MAGKTTQYTQRNTNSKQQCGDEPDEEYLEDNLVAKQQTITQLQARTNEELAAIEGKVDDLRSRLFSEGEAKAESGKKEQGYSSIESMAWESLKRAEHLNKTLKSVLARM
jgi:hypothetical protein